MSTEILSTFKKLKKIALERNGLRPPRLSVRHICSIKIQSYMSPWITWLRNETLGCITKVIYKLKIKQLLRDQSCQYIHTQMPQIGSNAISACLMTWRLMLFRKPIHMLHWYWCMTGNQFRLPMLTNSVLRREGINSAGLKPSWIMAGKIQAYALENLSPFVGANTRVWDS